MAFYAHALGGFRVERRVYIDVPQHIPVIHVREPGFEPTVSSLFNSNGVNPFPGHGHHSPQRERSQTLGPYCSHCGAHRGSDQGTYCSKCGKANGERRKTAAELNIEMDLCDAGFRNGGGAVARIHYPGGWS